MKKETQLTAVEWVLDWMSKNQYFIGNDLLKAVEQAKEMEKEQLKDRYLRGIENYDPTFKRQEQ
jgi:hypothetical protein